MRNWDPSTILLVSLLVPWNLAPCGYLERDSKFDGYISDRFLMQVVTGTILTSLRFCVRIGLTCW